jgi:hypothetical protein
LGFYGLLKSVFKRQMYPKNEVKKVRLIIQGVKSYIHLEADYLLWIRRIE